MTIFDNCNSSFVSNLPEYDETIPYKIYLKICDAAKEQDNIGCLGFYDGHVSKLWGIAQVGLYRAEPGNRRKGST